MAEQPESFGKEITQEVLDDFTNNPEKYSILEFQEIELARNTKILFDQFTMIAEHKKLRFLNQYLSVHSCQFSLECQSLVMVKVLMIMVKS